MRELLVRYRQTAEEYPEQPAVIVAREPYAGTTLTWAGLMERAEHLAGDLRRRGVTEGSRCAVVLSDAPDTLPLLLALWSLDATAVLVDGAWGERVVRGVLTHSSADHILRTGADGLDATALGRPDPGPPLPDGTALLGYTSGSTGDPKAIAFTHRKLALTMQAAAAASTAVHGSTPRRVALSMRMSGSGVLNLHYTWAAFMDATVVVLPELSFATGRDYWQRIDAYDIEQTFLVPQLVAVVNRLALPRGTDRRVTCFTGSAPVPAGVQEQFHKRFGLPLRNAYGMSETMCASFFGWLRPDGTASNSIGVPQLLRARLRDTEGRLVTGEGTGELELMGPTLVDGYHGNPAATAAAFNGPWMRTGDVARRSEDGSFTLVGRVKDAVMKGAYAIYLNEIEEAATALEDVREAAAVRLHLPDGSEDVGLLVRFLPDGGADLDRVRSALLDDLGSARTPRCVLEAPEPLPRGGQDKLDRKAVQRMWSAVAPDTLRQLVTAPAGTAFEGAQA